MADYGQHQARGDYPRPHGGGAASNQQRTAAYANIFGDVPQGRSQTMTSQSYQPLNQDRSHTMSAESMNRVQRGPPGRQPPNGYPPPLPHQYQQQQQQAPNYPNPPHNRPPPMQNQRPPPSQYPPPHHAPSSSYQQQPPQQSQYAGYPPRSESRQGPPQPRPPYQGAPPNRYPNQPVHQDPYARSQSLVSNPRPPVHSPPQQAGYNLAPAQTFRQQQYAPMSRTTAQGRVVPERPDERTMSMSSYTREPEHTQTMSGRVIPNRKRESHETIPDNRSSQSSIPTSPVANRQRTDSEVSQMPSRTFSNASTAIEGASSNGVGSSAQSQQGALASQRRTPLVYPALLSRVAEAFKERINLSDQSKDGLDYTQAFTGEESVTTIAYIIKTTDRNLALLLGRALDAQKFFHDVTYAHRLRDLRSEVYQFREPLTDEANEVNGVFTLLTECYSPTCTRDRLCYSIACPRRLEQQARLMLRPQPGLKRADSHTSLHEDAGDEQKLWINTVPKEVADSVSDKEKKRQEVISELAYTERDFVKDLEYMRDFWIAPLRNPQRSPIPEQRRDKFIKAVFSNVADIYTVNSKIAEAITKRQQEQPVVRLVGDILLEHVNKFSPFIIYGASQLFGKHEFENERKYNLVFSKFVDDTERLKESRKLELNGYLTKPTTRLARYPLLLENILKYTADDSSDKTDIPKVITIIRGFLSKVNAESGKAENKYTMITLNRELTFRDGERVDLKLTDENRQLIFKGMLKKSPQDQQGDIQVYIFDHAVLLVRLKTVNKKEDLKVYRKPIPLELLNIVEMNEILPNRAGMIKRPSSGLTLSSRTTTMTSQITNRDSSKQQGYPITFEHLGKDGYRITLYASTPIQQQKIIEHIDAQQRVLSNRAQIYTKTIVNQGFFTSMIRVHCGVPIDGGLKLVLGTENGIYILDRKAKDAGIKPKKVLDCRAVTQIEVLEQHQILLVLTDKNLYSFSMEVLESDENPAAQSKRGRKIGHASFFKAGVCQGAQLVCAVKTSALSSTIKVYEPMDTINKKSKKSGLAKMLTSNQDVLKPIKEFYIPTESSSIHFLRSKLCVGCARGFEVVSLETLEAQSLLDQADTSLDFVQRKENIKPVHIERIAGEFLLCYTDYSFFVNRNGWRARPEWMITWEGTPTNFAIFNPYILAFEPHFIEIRHMDNGMLMNIITAKNIRMLHSSSREILYAYEDEMGEDIIASLDFWARPDQRPAPDSRPPPSLKDYGSMGNPFTKELGR